MSGPSALLQATIGKKVVMALSGAVWVGYLVGHLLGNLQIFAGRQAINAYAEFLHHSPVILWGTRALLLASFFAHVAVSVQITLTNQAARPVAYARKRDIATTYAARTMVWSGPILLLFLLYHLAHLTLGVAPGTPYDPHDVYDNVVRGFRVPAVVALYVAAQVALGMHLFHGLWSALQTVGINHPVYNSWRRAAATALTVAIVGGYLSIPLSVVAGILRPAAMATAAAPRR